MSVVPARAVWCIALLWVVAALVPAHAQEGELTLEEVIRQHANGVPIDELIERVRSSGSSFEFDDATLARVQRAKLPARLMVALMESGRKKPASKFAEDPEDEATPIPPQDPDPEPRRSAGDTVQAPKGGGRAGYARFRQADGRFVVDVPEGWKTITTRGGRSTVRKEAFELAFVPPDGGDDLSQLTTFFLITYLPRKADAVEPGLEDWLKAYRQRLQMLEPGYTVGEEEIVELNRRVRAARLTAEGVARDQTHPLRVVFYGINDAHGFYLLRHGGPLEQYDELSGTFGDMMASLEIDTHINVTTPVPTESVPVATTENLDESVPHAETPPPDALDQRAVPFPYGGGAAGTTPPAPDRPLGHGQPDPDEEEHPLESFVEFADPDGRFRIQCPAAWKRASLATEGGVVFFFSTRPYEPRSGKPFSDGVSVTVQPNVISDSGSGDDMVRLATAGEGVRRQFLQSQEAARSLVRVHEPALLRLAGEHPGLVYRYTLTYPNGGDELGFFVVALSGEWIYTTEACAPRENYADLQRTLVRVVESLALPARR